MKLTSIAAVAAVAAALGVVLSGCGSDTKAESTSSSATSTKTTSTKAAAPSTAKVAPRDQDAGGPNPTIASYIKENDIQETRVNPGGPGSSSIDLPVPDGWEPANEGATSTLGDYSAFQLGGTWV